MSPGWGVPDVVLDPFAPLGGPPPLSLLSSHAEGGSLVFDHVIAPPTLPDVAFSLCL